jgi:hypothetical protein
LIAPEKNKTKSVMIYILGGIALIFVISVIILLIYLKTKNKDIKRLLKGK